MALPYRTPAPLPPGPSWWERHGDNVISIAGWTLFTCLVLAALVCVSQCVEVVHDDQARQFEERITACPIIDVDYGLHHEDPIMVTLDCKTYRERRRVPPGYKLPK